MSFSSTVIMKKSSRKADVFDPVTTKVVFL